MKFVDLISRVFWTGFFTFSAPLLCHYHVFVYISGTERQLQEIDRDINQIWKELQELEKLPNGNYVRQAATVAAAPSSATTRARTPPPSRPSSANSQAVPIQPVKIKAGYIEPVKIKAGYIGASPKYSEPVKSTITSTSKYSEQTPPSSRKGGPPR